MKSNQKLWVAVHWENREGDCLELDCAYEIQAPEPDVNVLGGVLVDEVQHHGITITDLLDPKEFEEIEELVLAAVDSDDGRGDYEYERMVERRLGL